MHAKTSELPRHSRPSILAADQPLVVPMILRISDLKLRGIVVLVVSKTKGVTLVFKNDPLESIRVSSTFDSVSILRDFLQRQIEAQLRNLFQEDLPVMIHNLSLRYIQSEEKKKEQEERQQKLLQQQQDHRSVSSEPSFKMRRAFSTISSPNSVPNMSRLSSNTYYSDLTLPELESSGYLLSPRSQPSSCLYTPVNGTFDLNDNEYNCYDDYLSSSPLSATVFGSFSDNGFDFKKNSLESNMEALHLGNSTDCCRTAPMTAANLFTHNRQFTTNNVGQLGISPLLYRDYHPMYSMMNATHHQKQQDTLSESGLSSMTTPCLSMSEMYASDADAPWYAIEGPELSSPNPPASSLLLEMDNIVIDPSDNKMAARLLQLATVNYTLSPLTETVPHFTFRSLPYAKKTNTTTTLPRHKKVPKRRVTRLNMSVPRL
jgi:distribution and morphology protein 34